MAESVGELFIRMGVDTSELDSGFVSAERTVTENLARLNREQHMIQIRGQIELDGLEETASASEKVRVQAEALTKQMEIQRDKIAMVSTAYEDLRSRYGETSEITQQAALALEKERLAMSNLQKQTADLSKQQEIALGVNFEMLGLVPTAVKGVEALIAAGHAIPIPHAKVAAGVATALLAVVAGSAEATSELRENNPAKVLDEEFAKAESSINNSWGGIESETERAADKIENTTAEINESISEIGESAEETADEVEGVFDLLQTEDVGDAIKKANDLFKDSDSILGRIAKTILGIAGTISAFEASMIKAAQPAIEGFRELSTTAAELNLSLDATNELLAKIKLAGADFNDVRDYVRGVQDAVIKGDSTDPEVIALEKYGVAIQDANGNLLAFDETLDRLYQGYLKAREAGEAEAYAMMTNGQAVKDILPYFESLAKAEEDRAKIQWSTTDAASLEQASRDLRLMETQIDEFKTALSSLAVPAADIAIKETFELFKKGTQLIEENRETIVYWSFVVMEAIQSVKKIGGEAADWILKKLSAAMDELKELNKRFGLIEKASGLFEAATEKIDSLKTAIFGESNADEESFIDRAKKDTEEYIAANEKARAETKKTAEAITAGLSYSYNRIAQYKDELAGIKIDLQFGDDKLGAELAKLEQWYQKALKDARYYEQERAVLAELYAAKREQIEQERADKLDEIRESIAAGDRTALENKLANLEKEKQAWISAGMEEAEATELAERKRQQIMEEVSQRVQSLIQEAANIEYHATHTSIENQRYDIEQWKQAKLEQAETAEEAAAIIANAEAKESAAINQEIDRSLERADSLNRATAAMTYHATHEAFENQLYDIEQWKEAQLEKATTAEEVAATIANAAAKEAEAFEREMDRIQGKMESAQDRLARLKLSQRDYDIYRAQKQYEKDLEELPRVLADAIYSAELSKIGRDTERANLQRRLKTANDSNRDWIQKQLDSLNLGYTDTPRQRYKSLGDAGDMLNAFQERLKFAEPLLTVNAKNYAKFKAQQELDRFQKSFPAATAKFTDVSDIFNGQLLSATASVTDFDKAIKHATGGLRGGNTSAGESTQGYQNLRELFRDGKNGRFPIVYLDELSKEVASLGSGTREALNKILDKAPEGVDVSPIRDLINNQIIRPQALGDAMLGLSDDLKAQLSTALTEGEKTSDMRSSEAMINSMANLAEKMQNAIETIETAKNDISTAAESVKGSNENLSGSLNQMADKVNGLREALANLPTRQNPDSQQQNAPDMSALTQELQNQSGILGEIKAAIQELPQQLSQSISETNQENTQALSEQFQQISQSISEITQGISQAAAEIGEQLSQSASDIGEKISQLLTDTTQQFSQTISETSQQITQSFSETIQQAGQSLAEAINQIPQQATETANQIVQSISETSQQLTQTLSEISQGLSQSLSEATQSVIQAIAEQTNQMVQALGVVSQAMAESARALTESRASQNQRSAPNINVSPTNNINLGGAYVFDNSMKRQLTDDIAGEVASAVTSAVQSATQQANYGYGT